MAMGRERSSKRRPKGSLRSGRSGTDWERNSKFDWPPNFTSARRRGSRLVLSYIRESLLLGVLFPSFLKKELIEVILNLVPAARVSRQEGRDTFIEFKASPLSFTVRKTK